MVPAVEVLKVLVFEEKLRTTDLDLNVTVEQEGINTCHQLTGPINTKHKRFGKSMTKLLMYFLLNKISEGICLSLQTL